MDWPRESDRWGTLEAGKAIGCTQCSAVTRRSTVPPDSACVPFPPSAAWPSFPGRAPYLYSSERSLQFLVQIPTPTSTVRCGEGVGRWAEAVTDLSLLSSALDKVLRASFTGVLTRPVAACERAMRNPLFAASVELTGSEGPPARLQAKAGNKPAKKVQARASSSEQVEFQADGVEVSPTSRWTTG